MIGTRVRVFGTLFNGEQTTVAGILHHITISEQEIYVVVGRLPVRKVLKIEDCPSQYESKIKEK